jgi:uncharacterized membrane protein YhaH (DUF805 family)
MWSPDGLVATVQRHSMDVLSTDALARTIALHAIYRDPRGAVDLGWLTLRSYFDPTLTAAYDPAAFAALITSELGPRTLPPANELEAYKIESATIGPSLTRRWHAAAVSYYPLILLCPLLALLAAVFPDRGRRPDSIFVFIVSAAMVATGPLVAASTVIRYLHPLAWMNVFVIVLLVQRATRGRASRLQASPRHDEPQVVR